MGLVTKTQPPLIGVDISSTAVKLLQLARTGDRYRVEHYAVEPLPPNAVVEKNLVEVEAVGEAIRRAVARSGSRIKHGAAAVSGSSVITKVIPMPADLGEDDLESQIELEAVNYINLSSAWECSRNDIYEGFAVLLAAFAVWVFGTGWPDLVIASALLLMFLRSASRVLRGAWRELRGATPAPSACELP